MKKFYVIDTNVLIQSPDAIKNFEDKSDNRILKVCKGLKAYRERIYYFEVRYIDAKNPSRKSRGQENCTFSV